MHIRPFATGLGFACLSGGLLALFVATAAPSAALTPGVFQDFQDGTTQGWTSGAGVTQTTAVADAGPAGTGDFALNAAFGQRAVVLNNSEWQGDWTAAGINEIEFAVHSPVGNPTDLTLWLGFSAGDIPSFGGSGETYVTQASQTVPSDGAWHNVSFDVTAAGWGNWGGNDVADSLTNVYQLRIIHNPVRDFLGATTISSFRIDSVATVPEPGTLAAGLLALATGALVYRHRSRRTAW